MRSCLQSIVEKFDALDSFMFCLLILAIAFKFNDSNWEKLNNFFFRMCEKEMFIFWVLWNVAGLFINKYSFPLRRSLPSVCYFLVNETSRVWRSNVENGNIILSASYRRSVKSHRIFTVELISLKYFVDVLFPVEKLIYCDNFSRYAAKQK